MRIESQRLLPGYAAGLAEQTALVVIELDAGGVVGSDAEARIRTGIALLCPEDAFYGIDESDWPGAFLVPTDPDRVGDPEAGRTLGNWLIALTVAVQRWARDPVWHGRLVHSENRRMLLAIPWRREPLFRDALDFAVRYIREWLAPVPDLEAVQELIQYLQKGLPPAQDAGLLPNTLRFIQAAVDREIPFEVLPNCVQLGWGAFAERIESSFTGRSGYIATMMAHNKFKSSRTLADAGLPLPTGEVVLDVERAQQVAAGLGWPVVVKPSNCEHGTGVVPGISDVDTLRRSFDAAVRLSPSGVIVEQHVAGDDHRLLVVDGRLLAAARRIPGGVMGDGVHTVEQLVDLVNADPRRGNGARSLLRRLVVDDEALDCVRQYGLTADSIPDRGRWIALRRTANISTGGMAVDVSSAIHPDNRALAERAARIVGLDIAGIDFLCPDISRSWLEVGGAICEVNAQPGFRPHWIADPGRDINGEILDILFSGRAARIPTAAIIGTVEASETALTLQRIWIAAGVVAGAGTRHGLHIAGDLVNAADFSGLRGVRAILVDPAVHAGIFEVSAGIVTQSGHPCDRYDVAGVFDVDGLQVSEFDLLTPQCRAMVINADDPGCMRLRSQIGSRRQVLVTVDSGDAAVVDHRQGGGEVVFCDGQGRIVVDADGGQTVLMWPPRGLGSPGGAAVRFAAALAWTQGIEPSVIRSALESMDPAESA